MNRLRLLLLLIAMVAWGCEPATNTTPEEFLEQIDIGFDIEAPPVFEAEGLRIATLNAEFLFDGVEGEGAASFSHKGDPVEARRHRDRIAAVIRACDADLVALQEVENREVMEMMVEESLSDLGYRVYFVQGRDSFTGQDVGLLSRIPIDEVTRTNDRAQLTEEDDTYGVSKNMIARFRMLDRPVTLINVHLLAQASNRSRRDRREAQAEVIRRQVVAEAQRGRSVIVIGDFNDYDNEVLDAAESVPVTRVLEYIKSADLLDPDDDLHNLIAVVPQDERFTALWDRNDNEYVDPGEFTAIDHILLSPDLMALTREVVYVHAHNPFTDTDHFPIVAVLDD